MGLVKLDQFTSDGRLRAGLDSWAIYAAFAPVRDGETLVKIGMSSRPFNRVYEIHCGSPYAVQVMLWAWVGSKRQAQSVERTIHRRLAEKRTRGEWFEFDTSSQVEKEWFHAVAKAAYARATGRVLEWKRAGLAQITEGAGFNWRAVPA